MKSDALRRAHAKTPPFRLFQRLIAWARAHKDRRVLIFTEYADTKRYLEKQLRVALTPGRDSDPSIATAELGQRWELRQNGQKPYACGVVSHPTIDAVRHLRQASGLPPNEIDSIRARVNSPKS